MLIAMLIAMLSAMLIMLIAILLASLIRYVRSPSEPLCRMAGRALCALCTEPAAATALVSGADCLPHQEDCLPHQADCLPHQADCLPLQADCLPHQVSGPTPPLLTILHSLPAVLGTPPFLSDGALGALHAALASSVREAARHAPGTALGAAPGEATEQTLRALTTALLAYADGRWEALTTTLHGAVRATDGGMGGGGLGGGGMGGGGMGSGGMGGGSGAAAAAAALPNMAKEAASVFRLYRYVIVQLGGRRLLPRLMTMLPAIRAMVDAVTAEQARLYVASGAVLGYAHVTGTKEARALRTARTEALRLLIACVHHFDALPPPSTASSTPSTAWSAADAAADAAAGGSGGGGGGGSGGGGGGARAFTALDSAETEAAAAAVLLRLPRSSGERELHQSHAEGAHALLPQLSGWLQVSACDCLIGVPVIALSECLRLPLGVPVIAYRSATLMTNGD